MSMSRLFSLAVLSFLAGCATADRVQALEAKVEALEKKVEELPAKAGGKAAPRDEKAEKAAATLYEGLTKDVQAGKIDVAKAKLKELKAKYSSTTAYRRARKLERELEVIGKPAPSALKIEKWYKNETKIDLASDTPTLLVFWELWCPHCKREVPNMEAIYTKNKGKLQMVGLTKVTRSATDEKITEFIDEKKLTYPMAKEDGEMSKAFNVSGIPAAAAVKGGKIIWRGHPGRLTDEMIAGWM